MLWDQFKKLLFQFDAEKIHDLSLRSMCCLGALSPHLLELFSDSSDLSFLDSDSGWKKNHKGLTLFDKKLRHPMGLAAGFDKNARLLPYLPALGFSFAEIGSVTLRPQSGNDKPRLFRDNSKGQELLFNRMGFNNDGAELIAKRLSTYEIPSHFAVGINLGLNKDTPHEKAAIEYSETFRILESYGDYFVINLSSPNTVGLRDLQELRSIEKIFSAIKAFSTKKKVFLKLAPEISQEFLKNVFVEADNLGIDAFVLSNTLKGERESQVGGWSGSALTKISRDVLAFARPLTKKPLISVGGIMSTQEAIERLRLGADLLQIYSGWIYRGPLFPAQFARAWKESINLKSVES